jgi:hypothetical protein
MKKIVIEIIPRKDQRYPTLGDYWIDENGDWQIRVSQMKDYRSEVAVALHELFEMASVIHRGIPIEDIDAFDMMFEREREEGKHSKDAEPGNDERAPYWNDHVNAENIERRFITNIGLQWKGHEENCADA